MCRTIQFDELIRGLAVNGFRKGDELRACFEHVDVDRSGGLEFSEVAGKHSGIDVFTNLNFELVPSD